MKKTDDDPFLNLKEIKILIHNGESEELLSSDIGYVYHIQLLI